MNVFSVPYSLGEIKDTHIISTRINSNSEEELIKKAIKFHLQGNISEAVKFYENFINQGFQDYRVFCNYGTILQNLGKYKDSELFIRKAIEIKPDFAYAHCNLGNLFIELGKLKQAEFFTRKAIEIQPDFVNAYYNLGLILKDIGEYKEAFECYLKVIDFNPNLTINYSSIVILLRDSDLTVFNKSKLENIITILLERNDISHQELFTVFNYIFVNQLENYLLSLDLNLSNFDLYEPFIKNKLIVKGLQKIIFKDIRWEGLLKNIRKYLLYKCFNNIEDITQFELKFMISLAEQCFFNEYIYSYSFEENKYIDLILNQYSDLSINIISISILACYLPLSNLLDKIPSLSTFNSSNTSFNDLIKLQILEPLEEIALSKKILRIGSINDDISIKVKTFYEKNPYPRWRYGNIQKDLKISAIQRINNVIKPNIIANNIPNYQIAVLVAGCGTGQHILNTQIYSNSKITAIDLSLTSLAYAQRKINELKINNVELIQMDLLELSLLKDKFDIIECSGVLVSIKEPLKGLESLLNVLDKNGFLKLGLYSELARKDVVKAREYLLNNDISFNEKNMRFFRQQIISGNLPELASLTNFDDFYTTSMLRDFCFHIQENRFTINQIKNILNSYDLKFHGFQIDNSIKDLYKKYFPDDKKQLNLDNWSMFEEKFPNTFIEMYQFWVSKC